MQQANPFAVGTAQPQQGAAQPQQGAAQTQQGFGAAQPQQALGAGQIPPRDMGTGSTPMPPGVGYDPDRSGGNYNPVKPMPPGLGFDPDRTGGNRPPVKPMPSGGGYDPNRPVKPMPPGLGFDPDRSGGNYNPGKPAPTQLGGPTGPQVNSPPNKSFIARDLMKQYGFPPQISQQFASSIVATRALADTLFSQYGTDRAALERDPRFARLQQQSLMLDQRMRQAQQRFGNQNRPQPLNANQMTWNEEAALNQANIQRLG